MKMNVGYVLALALCLACQGAHLRTASQAGVESMRATKRAAMGMGLGAKLHAKMGYMVQDMLTRKHTTSRQIVEKMHKGMRLDEALPRLESKLPSDVLSMLHMTSGAHQERSGSKREGEFSEVSLAKARIYLNNMMYDAWLQLDQIEVECKEFEESNRAVFNQVVIDLEHLGSELADKYRLKTEAEGCISEMERRIRDETENLRILKREYNEEREANAAELKLRQDDQDVFTAILQLSKCRNQFPDNTYSLSQIKICDRDNGTTIEVSDPALTEKLRVSPRAQSAVLNILNGGGGGGEGAEDPVPTLLQLSQRQAPPQTPVIEEKSQEETGSWKRCHNPTVNCGLLHDTMALEWGKFKDLVDELTYIMEQNHATYTKESDNLNEQIGTLRSQKGKCQEMLDEAVSDINALEAETRTKETQHREIERAYKIKMASCKERITEILFTNICGVRIVRNALMRYSTVSPTKLIVDCDVTDWSPGPCTTDGRGSSVAVDCDDGCPADVGGIDVDVCGGIKYLTRQIIVSPNDFGMACPPIFFERSNGSKGMKCNQFKCPVNCVMSEWTGFSSCSKECGGGTRGKTRSIITKNKNGGSECDSTLDEEPCHTGSCDRDCTLVDWTAWGPCNKACGGGMQKRVRNVDIPIRANGKCPNKKHADRLEWQECNTMPCVGDEICIAKQDLIIAIDGSGSMKLDGFQMMQTFAANLTVKYQAVYYGIEEMNMGLILFGNGEYFENGTVADAIQVQAITSSIDTVKVAIEGLEWQRGFTNMMQAMSKAETMFEDGRSDAQSALLIMSDGKYTNAYRTGMKAQALKDKGIDIFMAIVSGHGQHLEVLKGWVSEPASANFFRVGGFQKLMRNEERFAQQVLVEFCPRAFSPSQQREQDELLGYLKIHEDGLPADSCARWLYMPDSTADSVDSCFEAVKSAGSCPADYPYVWFTGNTMCCKTNQEKDIDGQGAGCDGSVFYAAGRHPMCCMNDESVQCESPPCLDYGVTYMSFGFEEATSRRSAICYAEGITVTDDLWASALNDQVNMSCPGEDGTADEAFEEVYGASTYIMNPALFADITGGGGGAAAPTFAVKMTSVPPSSKKNKVRDAIRSINGMSSTDAMNIVNSKGIVIEGESQAVCDDALSKIQAAGGSAVIQ